jgi:hypothetical protein
VIIVQVHGATAKEDLIMMGEGNNDMEEQIHNKKNVLICYPEFSTCSQKLLPAYSLWTAYCNQDGRAKSAGRETRVILILSLTYGKGKNVKGSGVPQGLRPTKRIGMDLVYSILDS